MEILFISIAFLGFLGLIFFQVRKKNPKHKKNIETSSEVLKKIRSFSGEYASAKLFTYIRKISPYVFEELLLTVFEENNYKVIRNKRYSGDGGIDGVVFKDGNKYLIQAKRYSGNIQKKHIKSFENVIIKEKAEGGFFIHTGRTGKKIPFEKTDKIKILSGERLVKFIRLELNTIH